MPLARVWIMPSTAGVVEEGGLGEEGVTEGEGRESLCWIRMTRTARQDARRSGKEDAGQSLFWKNASSDFTGNTIVKLERGLVGT